MLLKASLPCFILIKLDLFIQKPSDVPVPNSLYVYEQIFTRFTRTVLINFCGCLFVYIFEYHVKIPLYWTTFF
jgi:hypothetical protein